MPDLILYLPYNSYKDQAYIQEDDKHKDVIAQSQKIRFDLQLTALGARPTTPCGHDNKERHKLMGDEYGQYGQDPNAANNGQPDQNNNMDKRIEDIRRAVTKGRKRGHTAPQACS